VERNGGGQSKKQKPPAQESQTVNEPTPSARHQVDSEYACILFWDNQSFYEFSFPFPSLPKALIVAKFITNPLLSLLEQGTTTRAWSRVMKIISTTYQEAIQ
jgi:hypothetical protein